MKPQPRHKKTRKTEQVDPRVMEAALEVARKGEELVVESPTSVRLIPERMPGSTAEARS